MDKAAKLMQEMPIERGKYSPRNSTVSLTLFLSFSVSSSSQRLLT